MTTVILTEFPIAKHIGNTNEIILIFSLSTSQAPAWEVVKKRKNFRKK